MKRARLGEFTYVNAARSVVIGRGVMLGPSCHVTDANHRIGRDRPIKGQGRVSMEVVIEDDVWVGAGAKILMGVTVGQGAVIGAGAVVTADIPPYAVAAGVPARVIGHRR